MWRPVVGYEGYYEVSDRGELRSVDRICIDSNIGERFLKGRPMKQTVRINKRRSLTDGYMVVSLHKKGDVEVANVHRLVAQAFISNPNNYPIINHIDGNKKNNNVSNLEWTTYSRNNQHALDKGLRKPRGVSVVQRDLGGNEIKRFRSVCEASRETGIGRSIISHCVNHRVKSAGGFLWEKINECNDYLGDESTSEDEFPMEAQEPLYAEDIVCSNGNILS